jgi:hypothetical protein
VEVVEGSGRVLLFDLLVFFSLFRSTLVASDCSSFLVIDGMDLVEMCERALIQNIYNFSQLIRA